MVPHPLQAIWTRNHLTHSEMRPRLSSNQAKQVMSSVLRTRTAVYHWPQRSETPRDGIRMEDCCPCPMLRPSVFPPFLSYNLLTETRLWVDKAINFFPLCTCIYTKRCTFIFQGASRSISVGICFISWKTQNKEGGWFFFPFLWKRTLEGLHYKVKLSQVKCTMLFSGAYLYFLM